MTIQNHIDEDTALSIEQLVEQTGWTQKEVREELEQMMERGEITSTPGWNYRLARRGDGE